MGGDRRIVDVTDNVTCFEKGKTFECECGQGFGVKFDKQMVRCPTCGAACIDEKWMEREPKTKKGQTNLADW